LVSSRYIYVPLGGTKNVIFTSVLIFTFVALWHDLSFRLLAWGWLVSLFFIPELAARVLLPASKVCLRVHISETKFPGTYNNAVSTETEDGIDTPVRWVQYSTS
jgi:D-alanyl-lipoteichoic acid acyltransferase DltB (MBOAT superfamily)